MLYRMSQMPFFVLKKYTTLSLAVVSQILDALHKDYRRAKLLRHGSTASLLTAGGGLAGGSVLLGAPVEMAAGAVAMTLVSAGGLQVLPMHDGVFSI